MESTDRQLIKIAETIRSCLTVYRNSRYSSLQQLLLNVGSSLEQLAKIRSKLAISLYRNWTAATISLMSRAQRVLQDVSLPTVQVQNLIEASKNDVPSLRLVYEELRQAREEFGSLKYDPDEDTLSICTEPIELEGVFLGDFEIQLQILTLMQMGEGNIFKVVALDPHPASCNDTVTHPHVSDESLCTGDATLPIQAALTNGRICDFFLLVRSVLQTYNPSSPYVSLSDWEGVSCDECGYTIAPDDSYYCESCGNTQCEECISSCSSCSTCLCQRCMSNCSACEQPYCESCLKECDECGDAFCPSCMNENLCKNCFEEMENEDEEETVETTEPSDQNNQEVA